MNRDATEISLRYREHSKGGPEDPSRLGREPLACACRPIGESADGKQTEHRGDEQRDAHTGPGEVVIGVGIPGPAGVTSAIVARAVAARTLVTGTVLVGASAAAPVRAGRAFDGVGPDDGREPIV